MIYWFRYVPDQFAVLIPAILIFISIYSYVNLNILTNDNYYNGFPAIWNVIVLYFYIFGTSQNFNLIFLILLILLKFSICASAIFVIIAKLGFIILDN